MFLFEACVCGSLTSTVSVRRLEQDLDLVPFSVVQNFVLK